MTVRTKRAGEENSVPQQPQTTPYGLGFPGHDFTLQTIVQLQGTLGELKAEIRGLTVAVDGVKSRVDDLVKWKQAILGGAVALGAVIALVGFLVTRYGDRVVLAPASPPVTGSPAVVGPVPPAPSASR